MTSPSSAVTCSAAPVRWRHSSPPPTAPPHRQPSRTGGCPKRSRGRCCRWFHSASTGSPDSSRARIPSTAIPTSTTSSPPTWGNTTRPRGCSPSSGSWSERLETDWLKYKDQGGKLQLLLLSRPNFNDQPEMLRRAMKLKPMGIAQHGVSTNRFWDAGQFDNCRDYLKHIRETGVMVGLSCHNPPELEPPLPGDSAILGAATWSNGLGGRPFVANASARCHPVRRTTPRSRQRTRKHCLHL